MFRRGNDGQINGEHIRAVSHSTLFRPISPNTETHLLSPICFNCYMLLMLLRYPAQKVRKVNPSILEGWPCQSSGGNLFFIAGKSQFSSHFCWMFHLPSPSLQALLQADRTICTYIYIQYIYIYTIYIYIFIYNIYIYRYIYIIFIYCLFICSFIGLMFTS